MNNLEASYNLILNELRKISGADNLYFKLRACLNFIQ